MTVAEIRDYARRYARVSSSAIADTNVNSLIDIAQRTFAEEVGGLPAKAYLAIQESFDMDTTMGFSLEISGSTNNDITATDIAVTDVDAQDQTGAQAAAELQAQIRAAIGAGADLTVAWADYAFTISAITTGATLEISAPSGVAYSDATDRFFGGTQTGTTSITCSFPEGCTFYADLPSDFSVMEHVYWDKCELTQVPMSAINYPQASGTPAYYAIRGSKLFIYPVPESQEELYIEYKSVPAIASGATNVSSLIPEEDQMALAYWVSSEMLKQTFEDEIADLRYKDYLRRKSRYLVRYHNNRPAVQPRGGIERPYRVVT